QLWRPGERGPARPRTDPHGDDVALEGDPLRWRCVFEATRPSEHPPCTTGCAFQIDVHCTSGRQDWLVGDAQIPWSPLPHGRYRANTTVKTSVTEPEYASIDIVTADERCWIEVDQLTNRDASTSARAVAELVLRVLAEAK